MKSTDRQLAESAMTALSDKDNFSENQLRWPPAADRIRKARLNAGRTDIEVARSAHVSLHSYWDLEHYDAEAFTAVSLWTLAMVGRVLSVEIRAILVGQQFEGSLQTVTFDNISKKLIDLINAGHMSADELGERIGWDIRDIVADPNALWDYNVDALYDICKAVGLDWVAALPDHAQLKSDVTSIS